MLHKYVFDSFTEAANASTVEPLSSTVLAISNGDASRRNKTKSSETNTSSFYITKSVQLVFAMPHLLWSI